MFFSASLALLALPNAPLPKVADLVQDRRAEVKQAYEELAAARDADALAALWRENVDLILQTIDADLEGSLSLWEKSPQSPDESAIAKLHERALFGATVASEATGHPIFADYAASFVGWDDQQKADFRAGQAVYGAALEELKAENFDVAHHKATVCRERAMPLGDWWGTAMGYSAEGRALQAGGHLENAVVAYSQSRLIYHDLGLFYSEYQNLRGLLTCTRALERASRARVLSDQALGLARSLGDEKGVVQLLETRAWAEGALGMEAAAAATEAELSKLQGED